MNIACFDIGGTQIKSMLKTPDEEIILKNIESRAAEGAEFLKADIFAAIRELKNDHGLEGVAISTAGMVDGSTMKIAHANYNFKNYIGFDWAAEIKKEFGLPAIVENDVKAAAIGEYYEGAGKGYDSLFALTVGTGIGGALIVDGKVYRGASGQAGEIGYMPIDGKEFEKIGSTSALIRRAKAKYPEKGYTNGYAIFEAIARGEAEATELIDNMTTILAKGIANIILIANPSLILIGGGISEQEEKFIDPIREKVAHLIPANIYESTTITNTSLGNKSGLYGAYSIFMDKYGKEDE